MNITVRNILIVLSCLFCLSGCIHEYPKNTYGGKGDNPYAHETWVEISYDLIWEELLYNVETGNFTRASEDQSHHFVVEVTLGEDIISHDEFYLTDDEFYNGNIRRRLSVPLSNEIYNIAAWYDRVDENSETPFNTDDLSMVTLEQTYSDDYETAQCAYAGENLDLSEYDTNSGYIVKELKMSVPGARFKLITTDVMQFITGNDDVLDQSNIFTVRIGSSERNRTTFNAHTGNLVFRNRAYATDYQIELFRYDYELLIGEGYVFCNEEDEIELEVTVLNSALLTVSQTDTFVFPIKRGYITTVTGAFLTCPINSIFTINHIWEGEIHIDL